MSLKRLDDSQEELARVKEQIASLQASLQSAKDADLRLKEEVSTLTYKLKHANFKRDKIRVQAPKVSIGGRASPCQGG